jgi:hypothetical protein
MPSRKGTSAATLQRRLGELSVAAPLVVAHRLTRMAAHGHQPNARERREMHRMGAEKVAAFWESWAAMALQAASIQQQALWSLWRAPTLGEWQRNATRVLGSGLKPVHRRALANAKRLGR